VERNQLLFLVVVGAGAALLGVLTAPLFLDGSAAEAPSAIAVAAPLAPAPAEAPTPAADGPTITRTTSIPRPQRASTHGAKLTKIDAADGAGGADAGAQGGEDTAAQIYGAVDPDREFTPDEIRSTVDTFKDDIEECLEAWGDHIPGFDGRIVVQAEFSPDGLQDVRIPDIDGVPTPLLGCFSTPLWEATWPQPDGAVTISYPFVVELGDGDGDE
jgi:hypothetical protein